MVVFGGGGVGKSSITIQLINHHFIDEYDPTIEDTYRKQAIIDNENCLLHIVDTAGQGGFSGMRDRYLRTAQGFLLMYSVVSRSSFYAELHNIRDQLIRAKDMDEVPIVLVGNKCDLDEERQVEKSEGENLAKEWNCPFFETSARFRINIEEIFFELVREIRANPNNTVQKKIKKKECLIM